MASSVRRPKEWVRKRKLQNFGLRFRDSLGPEPRNFSPQFCNFLLRTHSFGLRKVEFICLFKTHCFLFELIVVFKPYPALRLIFSAAAAAAAAVSWNIEPQPRPRPRQKRNAKPQRQPWRRPQPRPQPLRPQLKAAWRNLRFFSTYILRSQKKK